MTKLSLANSDTFLKECAAELRLYAIFQPQAYFYDKVMNPWKQVYNGKCNLTLSRGAQMHLTIARF